MPNPSARVLVVEDNVVVRVDVIDALREAGYDPIVATTLSAAREAAADRCDLILLDLQLPDGEGMELCSELRTAGRNVPIIMLTGRDEPNERVAGLDAGADDYIVKPFHMPELLARIRTILRRSGRSGHGGFVKHLDLWVDREQRKAGLGDDEIRLKPREFELLSFLITHPGRAWTRQELIDQVWSHDFTGDARTVDLHVRRLRAKIATGAGADNYIETVWGVGYRMRAEGSEGAGPEPPLEITPAPKPGHGKHGQQGTDPAKPKPSPHASDEDSREGLASS